MEARKIKIVFFGEGVIAAGCLPPLLESFEVMHIFTTEAEVEKTRRQAIGLVTQFAKDNGVSFSSVKAVTADVIDLTASFEADFIVVVSFGLFLPGSLLRKAKVKAINLHPSALPKYRGAAPIARAIENGDDKIGVCVIEVTKKMDAGDIFAKEEICIGLGDCASDVYSMVGNLGGGMLRDVCIKLFGASNGGELVGQNNEANGMALKQNDELATMANKVQKEEMLVDFTLPASVIVNKVRAFDVFGGCYFVDPKYGRVKIWKAEVIDVSGAAGSSAAGLNAAGFVDVENCLIYCGQGTAIKPLVLQKEGRGKLPFNEFWRGYRK